MLGDILLIKIQHEELSLEILEVIKELLKKKERISIAVSGESGAGKSELAHVVRTKLKQENINSKIIHTDSYYNTLPEERREWRKKNKEKIGLNEYNWALINEHINAFVNKSNEVKLEFVDIVTKQVDKLLTNFAEIDVLILEGLYAIKADVDYRFFIKSSEQIKQEAQLKRGKEALDDFRKVVLKKEEEAVNSIIALADKKLICG